MTLVTKLLDWPFLTFVFGLIVVFTLVYHRQSIGLMLGRREITLAVGRNRVKIGKLARTVDEELGPIRDDIADLQAAIAALKQADGGEQPITAASPLKLSEAEVTAARFRMKNALESGSYTWRSIERLARIGKISEDQAMGILLDDTTVVVSRGKSGRQIARLRGRRPTGREADLGSGT